MRRRIPIIAACLIVLSGATGEARAATITGYDIPQTASGYTSIALISGGSPNVSATPLSRTANLTGSAFPNHFYFSNWGTSVDSSKYYSTTLTVDSGYALNLGDLTYSIEDTPNHSPGVFSTFHVRSSLDGFASDLDSFTLNNNDGLVVDRTTDLSGLGPITGPIEFRFYATAQTPVVAVGFANHLPGGAGGAADEGQNIRFSGAVSQISAVPEPSSLALWGVGLGVAFVAAARRRQTMRAVY